MDSGRGTFFTDHMANEKGDGVRIYSQCIVGAEKRNVVSYIAQVGSLGAVGKIEISVNVMGIPAEEFVVGHISLQNLFSAV